MFEKGITKVARVPACQMGQVPFRYQFGTFKIASQSTCSQLNLTEQDILSMLENLTMMQFLWYSRNDWPLNTKTDEELEQMEADFQEAYNPYKAFVIEEFKKTMA